MGADDASKVFVVREVVYPTGRWPSEESTNRNYQPTLRVIQRKGKKGCPKTVNEANASETTDVSVANPVAHIDSRNLVV